MEGFVSRGLVNNIGISNFNIRRTKKLLDTAVIPPFVNQVECNLSFPQTELIEVSGS